MSDRDEKAASYRWGTIFVWVFIVLVLLVIGSYFQLPFMPFSSLLGGGGSAQAPYAGTGYPPSSGSVAIVSSAQGAQDAETAETPVSESVDRQHCYDRLIARRMRPEEATQVCEKVIGALYN